MSDNSNAGGGIGLLGALTLLFIYLRLTGTIEWGWLWILAPIWGPLALVIAIGIVAVLVTLLISGGTEGARHAWRMRKAKRTLRQMGDAVGKGSRK